MITKQNRTAILATVTGEPRQSPVASETPRHLSAEVRRARHVASPNIALLTGGGDRPYALGLSAALLEAGLSMDFIGSDELKTAQLLSDPGVKFLNLRGDQRSDVSPLQKLFRVCLYYFRLIRYAAFARPKVFHILWNGKFQLFDRTALMVYFRLLGKRITLTAHNVNAGKRDGNDSWLNRFSLGMQYHLVHHIFVHTVKMKNELADEFGVSGDKISVIPFGINNTVPNGHLTPVAAKDEFKLDQHCKTLLFFGGITPYKGLEYLIEALAELAVEDQSYRLLIAGKPKEGLVYWSRIQKAIQENKLGHLVIVRDEHIPDERVEAFFKAADVLILPYTHIFQSGVLFLGYSFGLPVIAADVGSLRDEIIDGKTGFTFPARDGHGLAVRIREYFRSDLYGNLSNSRQEIRQHANERYSWTKVAEITTAIYSQLRAQ